MSAVVPPPAPTNGSAPVLPPPRSGTRRDVGVTRLDRLRVDLWNARGTTRVTGDADVGQAVVRGTTAIGGQLNADRMFARGSLDVARAITITQSLEIVGTFRFGGPLTTGALSVHGISEGVGPVNASGPVVFFGPVELQTGGITAARIGLHGTAQIPGTVRGGAFTGRFSGRSTIEAVEATTVAVERILHPLDRAFGLIGVYPKEPIFHVGRMEAKEVYLEAVEIDHLTCTTVTIGPGCHITRLDGEVRSMHKSSSIGFRSRSAIPRGLTR